MWEANDIKNTCWLDNKKKQKKKKNYFDDVALILVALFIKVIHLYMTKITAGLRAPQIYLIKKKKINKKEMDSDVNTDESP